jgi:hypothetical protein
MLYDASSPTGYRPAPRGSTRMCGRVSLRTSAWRTASPRARARLPRVVEARDDRAQLRELGRTCNQPSGAQKSS